MPQSKDVYRFLSLNVWGALPPAMQRGISRSYTSLYNQSFSKHLIKPYCRFHYGTDDEYLAQFKPASGEEEYQNFQDFFTRTFAEPVRESSAPIWGCEGLLCDHGQISELELINVKGDRRHPRTIFGAVGREIPDDYVFANIFLHNNNYHRIHSPVTGHVRRIERIQGDLVLLRPWVYRKDPSHPALRNERVNVDLVDESGKSWYISIVGGPAVGTIEMSKNIYPGARVKSGQELGLFLLGSTCCLAMPVPITHNQLGDMVAVTDPI